MFCLQYYKYKFCFPGTKAECKNEGQQAQWIKMQNVATTTKQTLLQEKNLTAVITRNNVQNNIASPVSSYIEVIFRKNFNLLFYAYHLTTFSHLFI